MRRRSGIANEQGMALLMAIGILLLLAAIGGILIATSRLEMLIVGASQQSYATRYAAEGAAARAVHELGTIPLWTPALTGAVVSSFTDGAAIGPKMMPGGDRITLCCGAGSLTAEVQRRAHGGRSWGGNTPQWQLFAWGPVDRWLTPGRIVSPLYVAAWIADDLEDGDGDPYVDSNGFVELHVHALAPGGGRRVLRVLVSRPAGGSPADLRVHGWRDLRW